MNGNVYLVNEFRNLNILAMNALLARIGFCLVVACYSIPSRNYLCKESQINYGRVSRCPSPIQFEFMHQCVCFRSFYADCTCDTQLILNADTQARG